MRHFLALSRKNWINYKRTWCGAICEFLCPIILLILIVYIKDILTDPAKIENIEIKQFRHPLYLTADIPPSSVEELTNAKLIKNPEWVKELSKFAVHADKKSGPLGGYLP